MNKVIIMGRLTRDPEVRFSNHGDRQLAIARYTLAVDRRKTRSNDDPATDYISCVAFGRTAEFAERYLRKGTKLLVTGRIQTGSYTNKDGARVYTTDVMVEESEFCESKSSSNSSGSGYGSQQPSGASFPNYGDGFMGIPDEVDDDGLPFN